MGFQREPSTTARCSTLAFLVAVAFTCLNMYLSFHNAEHHVQATSAHGVAAMEMDKAAKMKKQAQQSNLFTAKDTSSATKSPALHTVTASAGGALPRSPPSKRQPPVFVSSQAKRQQKNENRKSVESKKVNEGSAKKQALLTGMTQGTPASASKAAGKIRTIDAEAYYAEFEEDFSYDSEGEEQVKGKPVGSQVTGVKAKKEKEKNAAPLHLLEPQGSTTSEAGSSVTHPKASGGSGGSMSSRGDGVDDVTYFGEDETNVGMTQEASSKRSGSASMPIPVEEENEYFGEEER